MPCSLLRRLLVDRAGPRGFVRSTSRPYSTSPGRPRGMVRCTSCHREHLCSGELGRLKPKGWPLIDRVRCRGMTQGGHDPRQLQEQAEATMQFQVAVTYSLQRGEEFPSKTVVVTTTSGESVAVLEQDPFHALHGCQVQRPSDDCPSRSGSGR